jgi:hypothetical protein
VVLARREAMDAERTSDRPPWRSTTEMPPDDRTDEPPTGTALAARAPTTVLTPGDTRDRLRHNDDEHMLGDADRRESRGRTVRTVAAVVAVVVLLIGAGLALRAVDDSGDDDPAVAPDSSTTAAPFTSAQVVGGRSRAEGVRSDRTYRLTERGLASVVELTNTTKKPVTRLWAEVVPKEVADHVSKVGFKPRYTGLIQADPIVYWRVRLPAGATKRLQWSTRLPAEAKPSEDYLNLVVGWHEEAVTDATPLIERKLAALAREGESVIKPPTPIAPDLTDGPTELFTPSEGVVSETPSAEEDDPPPPRPPAPPPNRAPRLSLAGSKSTGEQVGAGYTVTVSDPDGDNWRMSVSGAPPGIGKSGSRSLGGTVSHSAANVTTHKSSIRSRSFTVTITVRDEHGASTRGSFTWTVRDTHRTMPNYYLKWGNGSDGLPDVYAITNNGGDSCYDPSREDSRIVKQSVRAGSVIAFGQRVIYTYVSHDSSRPRC